MNKLETLILIFFLSSISGCVGRPVGEEILNPMTTTTQHLPEPESSIGVYHKVDKGETLWRIAKTYDVSVADIVSSNNIPNVAQIEKNQLIFIPGATALRKVVIEEEERTEGGGCAGSASGRRRENPRSPGERGGLPVRVFGRGLPPTRTMNPA